MSAVAAFVDRHVGPLQAVAFLLFAFAAIQVLIGSLAGAGFTGWVFIAALWLAIFAQLVSWEEDRPRSPR